MRRYRTSMKKKSENTKIQSCRFSLVIQQRISAHASLFSYPGSTATNPVPHQALELCNCLFETKTVSSGLTHNRSPTCAIAPRVADPLQLCEFSAAITTLQKLIPAYFTDYRPESTSFCSITLYKISGDFRKKSTLMKSPHKKKKKEKRKKKKKV